MKETLVPQESQSSSRIMTILDWITTNGIAQWNRDFSYNRYVDLFALALIITVFAARVFIGLTGTRLFSHDAFAILDPAWRTLNGQVSHRDFFDNLGPVAYFPTTIGLLLAGGKVQGFGIGQGMCAVLIGCWTYVLSRGRLLDLGRPLLLLTEVSIVAAPFALGYSPIMISPAMTYNRYGYALIALILLEALVAPRSTARWSEFAGGFSTGSIIILLLFTKITFFIGAAFLLGVLIPCRPQNRVRWVGLLFGLFVTFLLFSIYFHFDFLPMYRDLRILAGAKQFNPDGYVPEAILENAAMLLVFTISIALFCYGHKDPKSLLHVLVSGCATCLVGVFFIFTNFERLGFPLQAILPIFLVHSFHGRVRSQSRMEKAFHFSILLCAGVLALTVVIPSAVSLSYGVAHKIRMGKQYPPFPGPLLGDFIPIREDDGYRLFVDDGFTLLESFVKQKDSVISLDFSNPFSYGLGLSPAQGGAIALQYGTTFDDRHRPTPERLIGNATLVVVPKVFFDPANDNIPRLYGPYLRSHFTLISESARWRLYRKN